MVRTDGDDVGIMMVMMMATMFIMFVITRMMRMQAVRGSGSTKVLRWTEEA